MKKETKTVKETAKTAAEKVVKTADKTVKAAGKTMKAAEKAAVEAVKTAKETAPKLEEKAAKAAATVKETAKKAPARRTAVKESFYLQYGGKEIDKDELVKRAKEEWMRNSGKKASELRTLTLYLKPEENSAYYVINGDETGRIDL